MSHHPQRRRRPGRTTVGGVPAPPVPEDGGSVDLDLLQADLYRMLDEIARAGSDRHPALVLQFESAWERFKEGTAGSR